MTKRHPRLALITGPDGTQRIDVGPRGKVLEVGLLKSLEAAVGNALDTANKDAIRYERVELQLGKVHFEFEGKWYRVTIAENRRPRQRRMHFAARPPAQRTRKT